MAACSFLEVWAETVESSSAVGEDARGSRVIVDPGPIGASNAVDIDEFRASDVSHAFAQEHKS